MITETTSCKRKIFFYENFYRNDFYRNDDHETFGVPVPPPKK